MTEKLTEVQIRKRIRFLLAQEIRVKLYGVPDYMEHEHPDIEKNWSNVVGDIADTIWLETRPGPPNRAAIESPPQ